VHLVLTGGAMRKEWNGMAVISKDEAPEYRARSGAGAIEARSVTKSYGEGENQINVLKGVDLIKFNDAG